MPLLADWDPGSGLVVAFLDPENPMQPYAPTGAPVPTGTVTQRLPVRTTYPDPYVARLPELLGVATIEHDPARGVLVRRYPEADYSPTAIRSAILRRLDDTARVMLSSSDWVVIRRAETGEAIPAILAAWRHKIRAWHADREVAVGNATPGELLVFPFEVVPELGAPPSPRDEVTP